LGFDFSTSFDYTLSRKISEGLTATSNNMKHIITVLAVTAALTCFSLDVTEGCCENLFPWSSVDTVKDVLPDIFQTTFTKSWQSNKTAFPYYWVSEDNRFALWFFESGIVGRGWIVGDWKNWNTTTGYAYAEASAACPEYASNAESWKFHQGIKGWVPAQKGLGFYCGPKNSQDASFKRQQRHYIRSGRSLTQTMKPADILLP